MQRLALLVLLWIALVFPAFAELGWEPDRIQVFVVGVLEFQDKAYQAFPKKHRRDAQLVEFFRARGVKPERIVFLKDREATLAAIQASFRQQLTQTRPGDLLFFYYAGHGASGKAGSLFLTPYDARHSEESCWAADSVFELLETEFKGSRVLLTADCCYSGALARHLQRHRSRLGLAALTSSSARQISTSAWTFSDALLDALRGASQVDLNRDGEITLSELSRYVEEEMLFGDEQLSAFACNGEFPAGTVLAQRQGKALQGHIGERWEARDSGEWWRCRIVDEKGGRYKVHYYGYDSDEDAWISPKQVRAPRAPVFKVGDRVLAEYDGDLYPARIQREYRGVYWIRYDGYGPKWDEWMGPSRLKRR